MANPGLLPGVSGTTQSSWALGDAANSANFLPSGATVGGSVSLSATSFNVSSGAPFNVNTIIYIDTEFMLITGIDLSGPTLSVQRGYYNSVIATHASGATINNCSVIVLSNQGGVVQCMDSTNTYPVPVQFGQTTLQITDNNKTTVVNVLTVDHEATGATTGIGAGVLFEAAGQQALSRVYATYQGAGSSTLVLTTYQSSVEQVGVTLSNNLVTINQAAKIAGLGTAAPSLTIAGSGNSSGSGEPALYLTTTDTGGPTTWHFYAGSGNSSQNLRIGTGGTFDMINIDTSGHVLIGNTSGTSLLSVGSSAQLTVDTSGNLTAGADLKHTGMHVGFFNVSVVTQPSAVGAAAGYTAGTTVATFHSDDVYSGNTGTTKYTINGIVAALKGLGLLAA